MSKHEMDPIQIGYLNAYELLLSLRDHKKMDKKFAKILKEIIPDITYCIEMTKRMEMIVEAQQLTKKAMEDL